MRQKDTTRTSSATLADVARLAGVSPATVSRVLNEPLLVKPDTIEAVKKAIAQVGYTPNLLAGGLASSRTRLVAVIVPTIANSIFSDTVQAITDSLSQAKYQTLVGLSGYELNKEDDLLNAIVSRRPDGIILTGTLHPADTRARLLSANIPVVETWDLTPTPIDMVVGFSHPAVGQSVARHLMAKGYSSFGIISAGDQRAEARHQALRQELAAAGLDQPRTAFVPAPSRMAFGRDGLAQLLAGGPRPDVVVCSSDALAQGALAEAHSRGIVVPHDMAVMGFGDLDFAAYTYPALTTVRIDRFAIGRIAADALLARMQKFETPPAAIVDVGFSIVDRESA
jgi:LacI family gluconate utilization system Gnt-I transcriptional repressor